jgi:uncharacterized protein YuzE
MSYQTDNIAVAAALRSLGHQIVEITSKGRIATFEFSAASQAVANEIQMGTKLVDAISMHQELRRLSGLARSMANNAKAD